MAIDTAAKRASVLGFAFAALLLIPPDGTIGAGDRQTLCDLYSGIAAAAPSSAPVCVDPIIGTMRNTAVASAALMRNSNPVSAGTIRNTVVPDIGTMRNVLPQTGGMANTTVAVKGKLC